jgi:probable HAF family extracellular repeat protein
MKLPTRALMMTAAAFAASSLHAAVTFLPLGNLDPGAKPPGSYANDVSADGTVVVGTSFKTIAGMPETRAFRWTATDGMVALNPPPLALPSSMGLGCSSNGAVVAGAMGFVIAGTSFYEIRNGAAWLDAANSSLGTAVGTPEVPSYLATDVVANGSMIVGTTRWPGFLPVAKEMFSWGADGFQELGMMPGGTYSWADAVSADGSVIVGYGDLNGHLAAARWTKQTGVQPLPGLPDAIVASQASGVSPDGSIIVGFLHQDAIKWTAKEGIVSLGHFEGAGWAHALDLSADGSVIVGYNSFDKGQVAFIWTQSEGMQPLQDVLSDAGVDLKSWALRYAMGVSDDGRTIVGWGENPAGEPEAFLVQISQPEDLNGDGQVDGIDLAILLGQWGLCVGCIVPVTPPIPCPADLNGDCQVNGFDLAILLAAWG